MQQNISAEYHAILNKHEETAYLWVFLVVGAKVLPNLQQKFLIKDSSQ